MPAIDHLRRWLKDQFSTPDELIQKPTKGLRHIERDLHQMTPDLRTQNIQQVRSAAVTYYEGRHKENIPPRIAQRLNALERRAERLNRVDEARKVLEQLGGPPTKHTVQESLERSYEQRRKEFHAEMDKQLTKVHVRVPSKAKEHTHHMEP